MRKLVMCLWLALLAVPLSPLLAQPQTLRFYSHPTERYNILIPPGWADVSDGQGAQFANETLGARLWAFSLPGEDARAGLEAGAERALPGSAGSLIMLDTVNLITGEWAQAALRGEAASGAIFAQVYQGQTFIVAYASERGVVPLILPLAARVTQADVASSLLSVALERLGLPVSPEIPLTETTAAGGAPTFEAALDLDGQVYNAWLRGSSERTTDVLLLPEGPAADHAVLFTVLRDFFVTPNTSDYLFLGLAVVAVILTLFVASLIARLRNLNADEAALHRLAQVDE
jgi:hypothetical protein